jgi:hypothetical protein
MLLKDVSGKLITVEDGQIERVVIATGNADPWLIDYYFLLTVNGAEMVIDSVQSCGVTFVE